MYAASSVAFADALASVSSPIVGRADLVSLSFGLAGSGTSDAFPVFANSDFISPSVLSIAEGGGAAGGGGS
jgi:hypothetical protein